MVVSRAALLALAGALACSQPEVPEKAPVAPAQVLPPALVAIYTPEPAPEVRWHAELRGTLVAHLELGLLDLPGVIPEITGVPRAPGVVGQPLPDATLWTLRPSIAADGAEVEFAIDLCQPDETCTTHRASAAREAPTFAILPLLEQVALRLNREPPPGARVAWARPPSRDTYAILLEGRAAAVYFGYMSAPTVADDDPRRDPIRRAVLVDPHMPVAGYILARRELDRGRPALALSVIERATPARPQSVGIAAATAAAHEARGHPKAARAAWADVDRLSPSDLRFVLPRARAALAVDDLDAVDALLAELPQRYAMAAEILAVRSDVAEARSGTVPEDLLLAWQEASPADPDPVRRRIDARVRSGRYDEAIDLLPLLDSRGVGGQAEDLRLALLAATGRRSEAANLADQMGRTQVARRLRAADAADGATRLALLGDEASPSELAQAAILARDYERALTEADRGLRALPDDPRLHAARALALAALGRHEESERSLAQARWSDPLGVVLALVDPG